MREIKFRFWDGQYMLTEGFHVSAPGTVWGWVDHSCKSSFEMKGVLMQFTGLKDMNGKEIFEGDLYDRYGSKFEIIFYEGAFCALKVGDGDHTASPLNWENDEVDSFSREVEICGNIYENPELIQTDVIKEQD